MSVRHAVGRSRPFKTEAAHADDHGNDPRGPIVRLAGSKRTAIRERGRPVVAGHRAPPVRPPRLAYISCLPPWGSAWRWDVPSGSACARLISGGTLGRADSCPRCPGQRHPAS